MSYANVDDRYTRMHTVLLDMTERVHDLNRAKGWFDNERSMGDDVALMHAEVSEVLEAWRDYHDAEEHVGVQGKPEGVPSELADVLIRVLDTAYRYGVDIAEAFERKMQYNWTREYRHGGKTL